MRVAFLSFDFGEYSIRLANALAREADVLLLLPDGEAAPHRWRANSALQIQTFARPRFRQPVQQLQMINQLLGYINRFQPDVVHFQQGHLWFNFALPLLNRYPIVLTIHDPRPHLGDELSKKTPTWVMDFGFHRASQVIVHGKQLKQIVVDECRIPGDRIHVIPHIVLGDESALAQVPEEDGAVLFFGRIWPYKGLDYLIRAEPLITAQVPNAKIVIAGEGEDVQRYRQMMVHPERFELHNEYVSAAKQAELFRRASVVVLPYVQATQSGVIPVAYTFGKPVVATTVGALPEMVTDGQTGYLVPPCDEKALADAIVRLLKNQEQRKQMGANAKRRIDSQCSPVVIAQQTLAVYEVARGARQKGKLNASAETEHANIE